MAVAWATALLLGCASTAYADMFRCGSKVVSEADSPSGIEGKCGPPHSKARRIEYIRSRQPDGTMSRVREVLVEDWTYERGTAAPPFVVTVADGKVRSVKRLSASRAPD
jgi:hypothetical protein